MYHPTRGGVRGGRDQFSWDDVKVDKHRENYLGHSLKAPVGRWQKGKDLHWYTKDKKGTSSSDALKEEIKRIKEQEEQAMREALGLAPKSSTRPQGSRLDKHEFSELVKRGSTAEDLGAGHAEAAWVHGLGFAKAPRPWEDPSTLPSLHNGELSNVEVAHQPTDSLPTKAVLNEPEDIESNHKKRRREEKKEEKQGKQERHERRDKGQRQEKRRSRDSDVRKKHKKDKGRRRHDSDSD